MKNDKYWREPKSPLRTVGAKAWWYADQAKIEIYVHPTKDECRIVLSRRQLETYLRHTKEQPK